MDSKKILIVDDEPEVVSFLEDLLEQNGYAVASAGDAAGALELVRSTMFDAAILDFNLPDMDGVMLHRQLRQMDAELAANTIFISGMVQSKKDLDYYTAHGGGFLAKPIEIDDVLSYLRSMLGR
jgi:two-component system OmpR family response regulator